jgi:hypothetical protein
MGASAIFKKVKDNNSRSIVSIHNLPPILSQNPLHPCICLRLPRVASLSRNTSRALSHCSTFGRLGSAASNAEYKAVPGVSLQLPNSPFDASPPSALHFPRLFISSGITSNLSTSRGSYHPFSMTCKLGVLLVFSNAYGLT